jgi:hypothetical protein
MNHHATACQKPTDATLHAAQQPDHLVVCERIARVKRGIRRMSAG